MKDRQQCGQHAHGNATGETNAGWNESQRANRTNLAEQIRRGASAAVLIEAGHQLLNLLFLAMLYRALGLEPYGLLAIVVPLLYLARIVVTSGLDVATIQRSGLDFYQVSSLFWVQQVRGLVMSVAMVGVAPAVAWFYGEPRLASITAALAGTNLLATLGMQHFALLQRRLRLGTAAAIRLLAGIAGCGAALWAAARQWHVWALVLQMYVELAVFAFLAWWCQPFWPRFHWRQSGTRSMIRFGGQCAWANIMYFVMSQFDKVAVGYTLGTQAAALYSQAYQLASKPTQLVITRLTGIMLPALSRAQGDREFFRTLLVNSLRLIGVTMFPAGVGLALVAPEVMLVLGGEAWRPAGPLLAILALTILFQGFVQSFGTVLAAAGEGTILARTCTLIAGIQCAAVLLGLWIGRHIGYPLAAAATSYTVALGLVIFPLYLAIVLKVADVSIVRAIQALWSPARATLVMGAAVGGTRWIITSAEHLPEMGRLVVLIPIGVFTYMATIWPELRRLGRLLWSGSTSSEVAAATSDEPFPAPNGK